MALRRPIAAFLVVVGACCAGACPAAETPQRPSRLTEMIVDGNDLVFSLAVEEDRLLTLKGLRSACLMHLAMHDALNAIRPRFEPYAHGARAETADPMAAAAQAGFGILLSQYPDRSPRIERRRSSWLDAVTDGPAKEAGIALGTACAAAVMEMRHGDGWDTEAEYEWHPMAPGVYAEFNEHSGTPEGFVFGSGWALARPFVIDRLDRFRAVPPPDIESDDYTAAFDEVKEVGRFQSMTRTPDQTHLALWWKDFVENSHNRLARKLVAAENLDGWETTRLFALMAMSIFDAYVSSFDNKFLYNHWRPYTAIRWAENDGNPDTVADATWDNTHRHTYAFPSYPSAHGMASGAAMTCLAEVFGDETVFTMDTPAVDVAGPMSEKIAMWPPTRSFERFSQAAMECSMSRVYLGIHFRYDSIEGNRLGVAIGRHVVEHALRPLR